MGGTRNSGRGLLKCINGPPRCVVATGLGVPEKTQNLGQAHLTFLVHTWPRKWATGDIRGRRKGWSGVS